MLDKLSNMRAFQTIALAGSSGGRAAELGMSQSMVSNPLMRLEPRLGGALLHRSRSHLSLRQCFLRRAGASSKLSVKANESARVRGFPGRELTAHSDHSRSRV
jgi:DNA-binding transcriptional LysR family regulator